jgi:hypothetical protein
MKEPFACAKVRGSGVKGISPQRHRATERTNILAKPRYPKWFLLVFRFSLCLRDSAVKCSVGWDDALDGGFQFVRLEAEGSGLAFVGDAA